MRTGWVPRPCTPGPAWALTEARVPRAGAGLRARQTGASGWGSWFARGGRRGVPVSPSCKWSCGDQRDRAGAHVPRVKGCGGRGSGPVPTQGEEEAGRPRVAHTLPPHLCLRAGCPPPGPGAATASGGKRAAVRPLPSWELDPTCCAARPGCRPLHGLLGGPCGSARPGQAGQPRHQGREAVLPGLSCPEHTEASAGASGSALRLAERRRRGPLSSGNFRGTRVAEAEAGSRPPGHTHFLRVPG